MCIICFKASDYLQVEFVRQSCGEFLKGAIDDETYLSIWHLADVFMLEELMKEAKKHFFLHFTEVTRGKEFLSLPVSFLKETLADEGICVVIGSLIPSKEEREKVVWKLFSRMVLWIQQCRDGRRVLGGLKMLYENDGGESDWIQINDSDCECHEFHLENDERIVKVDVNSGPMIHSLTFDTRRG
ncbi:kelch-like protein 26 [Stylophora pistillata]|uniref:kelch-like protein 26 n=1 Tax=Stylophora pistillata TaxID=50429 RepID=UPI000C04F936|nr:kelch-like protein 26 [Stylophora pistillata]